MKFTGEMSAADIGRCLKLSQCKIAPSGLMVALRLVDGKLAFKVVLALHIFLDIRLGDQMLEISGELALLVHIRCQEGARAAPIHFAKGHGVHELELALRLMLNVGPTCWMVCAAH